MKTELLVGLTSIVVLGAAAQWIAWRLRIPSILLLLVAGVTAGPATGFLQPDALLGPLLPPMVSLFVAVILFEGGLSLKLGELQEVGGVVLRLITVGAAATWLVAAASARYLLGFSWPLAALLGAILVVTGPTVVIPILRHLRLGGQVGAILKWEGIVIDPIGASLAVIVYTISYGHAPQALPLQIAVDLSSTLAAGVGFGLVGAGFLYLALRYYFIPDGLQALATLAVVLGVFTASNLLQEEAGLLAVTVLGVALANQRKISIKHIAEFKENLTVLFLSSLFILLSARLRVEDLRALDWHAGVFLASLLLLARPAAVVVSTLGSRLGWRERLFLNAMAPRGIVAASVASVFSLELTQAGVDGAERLLPITFLVVFGTVLIYGLGAGKLAHRLGLAKLNPQGVLIVGAHDWARAIAVKLKEAGVAVLVVDSDWENICFAKMAGLPTHYGSILAETSKEELDFGDMGRMIALTSNNEVNSLACLRFVEVFGRREVYQLAFHSPSSAAHEPVSIEQRGRILFGPDVSYAHLQELFDSGYEVVATRLTREFDYAAFTAQYGGRAVALFVLKETGDVQAACADAAVAPTPGCTVISAAMREKSTGGAK